jgi:hypothetical protein
MSLQGLLIITNAKRQLALKDYLTNILRLRLHNTRFLRRRDKLVRQRFHVGINIAEALKTVVIGMSRHPSRAPS